MSSIKRANQGRVKNSRIDPIPGDQSTTGENPNPPTNQIQPPILVSQSDQPTKIDDNNNNNTEKVQISFLRVVWTETFLFLKSLSDRVGSDIERLWILNDEFLNRLKID